MKAAYKLKLEQHQRRLGLTHKELNKLDRKHNDINLLKQLQLLEPKVSAPAGDTGFWGTFYVENQPEVGSDARYLDAYLAYNDVPLTSSQQINSNASYTFNVTEANRLPLPSSTLQLKFTCQSGTTHIGGGEYSGFEVIGNTENPLDQENTFDILVNENNYDNGQCSIILLLYVP